MIFIAAKNRRCLKTHLLCPLITFTGSRHVKFCAVVVVGKPETLSILLLIVCNPIKYQGEAPQILTSFVRFI